MTSLRNQARSDLGLDSTSHKLSPLESHETNANALSDEHIGEESEDGSEMEEDDDNEEFFTPGSEDLFVARKKILAMSVAKASERIQRQVAAAKADNAAQTLRHRHHIAEYMQLLELDASYTMRGNTRALSQGRFNIHSTQIACSSWDGSFYIMDRKGTSFTQLAVLNPGYHVEKTVVSWNPVEPSLLVSGGGEGTINIWNVDGSEHLKPKETIKEAHSGRIAQMAFHPSGDYYASTSFDLTWKLWDLQRPDTELLEQEGHSKEVYAVSFHPDGSLVATGGLDTISRVWDLRSGRSIAVLSKHAKAIYGLDWSPNGFHLATASGDNSVQIWDLRKMQDYELFSIPAHEKMVSDVRFLQRTNSQLITKSVCDENDENERFLDVSGTVLVTSSFDGTVKVWSADNWICLKTLKGHNDRVMSCDISTNGDMIISTGWDRTLKTWLPDSFIM